MKKGFAALTVVGIAAAVALFKISSASFKGVDLINKSNSAFIEYLAKYGKSYKDLREFEMRKAVFEENMRIITDHNANKNETWSMGVNQFSDMLSDEISNIVGGGIHDENIEHLEVAPTEFMMKTSAYPIDWRDKMNPVRDQG
jgi:hypothetical protein